jgi:hypothetical protein
MHSCSRIIVIILIHMSNSTSIVCISSIIHFLFVLIDEAQIKGLSLCVMNNPFAHKLLSSNVCLFYEGLCILWTWLMQLQILSFLELVL